MHPNLGGGGAKPYLLLTYSWFGKFERHSQAKAGNPTNSLLLFLLESTEILPFVILKPLGLGIQLMLKIAGIENVNQIIIQSAGSPKLRFEDDGELVSNTNKPAPHCVKGQMRFVVLTDQPAPLVEKRAKARCAA